MPQEEQQQKGDRAEMIAIKHQHLTVLENNLAVLRSQREILDDNLEAYVAAERAAIQELKETIATLERSIASEANALFHLQSAQNGRAAPKPGARPAAAPASSASSRPATVGEAAAAAAQPAEKRSAPTRLATSTEPSKDEGPITADEIEFWKEKARRGEAGTMGDIDDKGKPIRRLITPEDIPEIARMAEGFDVVRPPREATLEGVKKTKKVAQWEMASDPDFSAADYIDQNGFRFVIDGKRHANTVRIFDQHNRLVFEEAMASEWGKIAVHIAEEDLDTPPELAATFLDPDRKSF